DVRRPLPSELTELIDNASEDFVIHSGCVDGVISARPVCMVRVVRLLRPEHRQVRLFVVQNVVAEKPDLTVFWSKEPDATNHAYGPGTYNSIDATKMNDEILGRIVDKLRQLGWEQSTDIIIT